MLLLRRASRSVTIAAAVACVFIASRASAGANPRLEWKTISTEHFDVHFHAGEEWTGAEAARDRGGDLRADHRASTTIEPKRCHLVILDTEDYANGAAYYYDNKVEIWATNLEFNLRGTTPWLRNVITHEFTHIVSIQASMKMPLRIPAIYFQAVDFETEKRPDVITGYPDLIVSYPITGTVVPAWWAEGVAQYQSPGKQNDCWDTHRDMILRAAVIEDRMLTYDQMGFLGHRSLGNEEVYDHGYGLVRYIAATYGPESLKRISEYMGDWNRLTIDGALEEATGKTGDQLYKDWKAYLAARYDRMLVDVRADLREGDRPLRRRLHDARPVVQPRRQARGVSLEQGQRLRGDVAVRNRSRRQTPGRTRGWRVVGGACFRSTARRSSTRNTPRVDAYGARVSDLYTYTFATKKEKRLTHKLRAAEPQWSPDGALDRVRARTETARTGWSR